MRRAGQILGVMTFLTVGPGATVGIYWLADGINIWVPVLLWLVGLGLGQSVSKAVNGSDD